MTCTIVALDNPWNYITESEVMGTTDDPKESKNLKYLNWYAIEYNGDVLVVLAWQQLTKSVASVSGWMTDSRVHTLLARSVRKAWSEFLYMLHNRGYGWVHASTLKTNKQGIRFNEHAGYKRVREDDDTIYWELKNG